MACYADVKVDKMSIYGLMACYVQVVKVDIMSIYGDEYTYKSNVIASITAEPILFTQVIA